MRDTKVRNKLFSFNTKETQANFSAAKKEMVWTPRKEYYKAAYSGMLTQIVFNKVNGTALCTGCGSEFAPNSEWKHKTAGFCPKCKAGTQILNARFYRNEEILHFRLGATYLQKGKNGSLCRCYSIFHQKVVLDKDGNAHLSRIVEPCSCLVIRKNGVRVRMANLEKYINGKWQSNWYLSNRESFVSGINTWFSPSDFVGNYDLQVTESVIRGTEYEIMYSSLSDDVKDWIIAVPDRLLCLTPQAEKLYKAGLTKWGYQAIEIVMYGSFRHARMIETNLKNESFYKMFGVTRPTLSYLMKENVNLSDLAFYQLAERLFPDDPKKLISQIRGNTYTFNNLIKFVQENNLDLKKICTIFLDDNAMKYADYMDYIRVLKRFGDYPDEKRFLYPRREEFETLHDEMMEREHRHREDLIAEQKKEAAKRKRKQQKAIQKHAAELERFTYSDGIYLIRPLANVENMNNESKNMHNCVKTYVSRYAERKCSLFTMRRVSDPAAPLATIEVVAGKDGTWVIAQMRGVCNTQLPDEISDWIRSWLERGFNAKKKKARSIVCA